MKKPQLPVPRPKRPQEKDDIHHWHMILNNTPTHNIKTKLRTYKHPAAATIKHKYITFSSFYTSKLKRAPHTRVTRNVDVGKIMCTDICGQLHPNGITGDVYFETFTDVGSRLKFVTPLKKRANVATPISDALQYSRMKTRNAPTILHADRTKKNICLPQKYRQKNAGTL